MSMCRTPRCATASTTAFSTAILSSVLIVGLSLTDAPAGTSIAAGNAPLDDQQTAFRYAFLLMTGLSVFGVLLASRLRDTALERDRPPKSVTSAAIARSAPQPTEGGGSS